MIGLSAIKSGSQDGHTFAFVPASAITLSPYMFKSAQVDALRDFVPVALVAEGPMMMAVSATSPANSITDKIVIAKKNPDTFVVTSPFLYPVPHLAGEVLARTAGVPIRGALFQQWRGNRGSDQQRRAGHN